MNRNFPVFLIDLDSVLIEPRGYRLSIQATLAWFTARMGFGDLYPGEDAIARLEAINMTSEWDITPVLLSALFEGLLRENPGLTLPADLTEACDEIRRLGLPPPKLDLGDFPALLASRFKPGMEYAGLALELCRPGAKNPLFPRLAGHPIVKSLLAGTRKTDGALTTKVFQHFTLGSRRYEEFTGLERLFESDSYLEKFDRVLLTDDTRDALLQVWQKGEIGIAVYTARPSLAEKDGAPSFAYSPEAEVAVEMLGLNALPLIGFGKIFWLASISGVSSEEFAKPSPVQALAAIAAAVTRQTEPALRAAATLFLHNEAGFYRNLPPLSIHVFEDSGGNTASVHRAVDILNGSGLACTFTAWGIGSNPVKQKALSQAGATLLPDINQAVQQAFRSENIKLIR